MHLLALVESEKHVCCRYRLSAFREHLETAGHTLELRCWPRGWLAPFNPAGPVGHADAVIVQRRLLAPWQIARLRRKARRLIFDFDDAVFLRDSYSRKGLHDPRRLRRFSAMLRACDAVTAGNAFLAEAARSYAAKARLAVVPTCVDPRRYPLAQHTRAGAGVQLVWIGSASTLQGLEMIRPLLELLGREVPGVELKLICDRFLHLRHLPVVPCPWSEASEASQLAGADIGLAWIPNDLWSRGKCGLKVLQYLAAGLPVVANPVGVQAEMIRHGENGFLAERPEEWVQAIATLSRDPELRRRMGAAGRRRLEAQFSVPVGARRWIELLAELQRVRPARAA